MGTDVYVVLGKINTAVLQNRPAKQSEHKELALFGSANVDVGDFTLMDLPEELDIDRNYSLFGWLADIRGAVKPYYPGDERRTRTLEFLDWLDQSASGDSVIYRYDMGEHGRIIHIVSNLINFNYDQIAEMHDGYDEEGEPIYVRPEVGKTYRELFDPTYFRLLEYCQTEGWDFIIFGFDS